jgi:hypothetical protein
MDFTQHEKDTLRRLVEAQRAREAREAPVKAKIRALVHVCYAETAGRTQDAEDVETSVD